MAKTKSEKRSAGRGAIFTVTELVNLYTIVRELLPVSGADWKYVADQHNQRWGKPERNPESCRNKCGRNHKAKPPTGDRRPKLPSTYSAGKTRLSGYHKQMQGRGGQ